MAKEKENKQHKSRLSLCQSGCYAEFYTLDKYFVKIKPALGIDKVLFAFVKKGTGGKGFDIYVGVDEFDVLCDSIMSKELLRNLTSSKMGTPAWEYITGHNGAKSIKIFNGSAGIVINGFLKDQKIAANIPVKYSDLLIMAKWHRRVSGTYFEKLAQICIEAMNDKEKYYKDPDDQEDSESSEKPATKSNTAGASQNTQGKKAAQDETSNEPTAPASQKAQGNAAGGAAGKDNTVPPNNDKEKPPKNPNEVFVMIKTKTTVQEYGSCGNYCFIGTTKNNKELIFIITPDFISKLGKEKWNSFYSATRANEGLYFNIGYVPCKDKLIITNILSVAS